jgi:hypothetical protein
MQKGDKQNSKFSLKSCWYFFQTPFDYYDTEDEK